MIHLLTSYIGGYIFKSKSRKIKGRGKGKTDRKSRRGRGKQLRNRFIPHPY